MVARGKQQFVEIMVSFMVEVAAGLAVEVAVAVGPHS